MVVDRGPSNSRVAGAMRVVCDDLCVVQTNTTFEFTLTYTGGCAEIAICRRVDVAVVECVVSMV